MCPPPGASSDGFPPAPRGALLVLLQVGVGGFWMSAFMRPRGFPVLNLNVEGDVLSVHLKRLPQNSQSSSRESTPRFPGDGVDGAAGPRVRREV